MCVGNRKTRVLGGTLCRGMPGVLSLVVSGHSSCSRQKRGQDEV